MRILNEIITYKEFLRTNVKKDIRGKYKGSFLGVLWSFINPLLSVVVYAIVFHYIMRFNIENYLIYLIAGIIPWSFFTTSVNMGMNNKKSIFPQSNITNIKCNKWLNKLSYFLCNYSNICII